MSLKPDPAITGLSDEERALLTEALCALRYVRGREWRAACHLADELGKRRPGLARLRIPGLQGSPVALAAEPCTRWSADRHRVAHASPRRMGETRTCVSACSWRSGCVSRSPSGRTAARPRRAPRLSPRG